MKTLYISDLDGTLLNSSAEVSEHTKNALNAMLADGLEFSVASARTLASASIILAGLNLKLPVVLMNGVLIYDMARREYTRINKLPPETVAAVIETLRRHSLTGFMYELYNGEQRTYHESLEQEPLRNFVEERISRYYKTFRHTEGFSEVSPENIIYFTLLDTHARLSAVHEALLLVPGLSLTFYRDTYSDDLWYLEMFSDAASKKNAVEFLRREYGYERVVCFGDNLNDLPMFEASDVCIASGNAQPEVRAAADFVCGDCDEDGVVRWLEVNLLHKLTSVNSQSKLTSVNSQRKLTSGGNKL